MRRENSKWSEKNKALAGKLEERGIMTDFGRKKIEEAKKNGQWDAPKKTYTRAYFDAKTDAGREKRIAWMVDRLNRNLKPM